jgi:hypothetical protein
MSNIQPTNREVLDLVAEIIAKDPSLTSDQAFEQARKQLVPTIIQALLEQLPANVEHHCGDQFYPDLYHVVEADGSSKVFARGRLDENYAYHLWYREKTGYLTKTRDYDLFRQDDLLRLIAELSQLASTQTAQPEPGGLSG